ncbi:MerR family transcriptional regulator [Streptomyces sp. VRA16 Mangrove soil]|uniref:helix-turn-helix domain-containing protein n=1 Tax=Streptomyces sp. VRA16 Mangrove soil TaxID=2817434 RepID=UPI001A9CD5D4|nr:MerR family transcriptional regulator [Streptomyces sp. VRA16 Mangrove soil]MBO1330131.1 MerR family transcriptional regulator [Streptomyces sp. VRA16 Mangrove soil]
MSSGSDGLWSIGELAEHAGTTVKTVRFYSDNGLLPERSRSTGGHRRYAPDALDRLQLIRSLRGLGLPVPEVRRIVEERAGAQSVLEDAVAGQLRTLGSQLTALRWQEAALRLVQECAPRERAKRLRLVGALGTPPSTDPLARFWRAWLPPRMPSGARADFLAAAVPQPPDAPAPEQVLALARLCALVSRPCGGTEPTQPAAHRAAGARESTVLYAGLAEAYALAAPVMRKGADPAPGEALDCFVATYATVTGLRDTPEFRRGLAGQLANDPRLDRYWDLVADLTTTPGAVPDPTPGTAHDWLLAALDAELATL